MFSHVWDVSQISVSSSGSQPDPQVRGRLEGNGSVETVQKWQSACSVQARSVETLHLPAAVRTCFGSSHRPTPPSA